MTYRSSRSLTPAHLATVVAALVAGATAASAGPPITPLLEDGDAVAGVGNVTSIDNFAINDLGAWMVEADTDNADTNVDGVLVRDGVLYLREGDPLDAPKAASIDSFDSIPINNGGAAAFNFFLDGTSGGGDDSGIYFDGTGLQLVVQESEEAPGLTPGTPFIGFFDVKLNNADQMLLMASVDDPNIASTVDRALYILETDPDAGGITTHVLVAAEGDILPGQTEAVADFETGPHVSAFNDSGHVLFGADLTGDASLDNTIYLYTGETFVLLAQDGDVSPVDKRPWSSLASPELDLNNNGDYVYSGSLAGDSATNLVIIRNDEKFRQEGDAVTTSSGTWALTSFGTGPLVINDCGEVLWYGDWDDPNADEDTGLFLDGEMLVQEGVTTIGGVLVDTIRGVQDGYAMSRNGRYIIFEAVLQDGTDGAYLIDRGAPCGDADCPEDLNGDGFVNVGDLLILLGAWGGPGGDVNGDGTTNVADLLAVLGNWGPCE